MRAAALQLGICAGTLLLVCVPLRAGNHYYNPDWINNQWLIGYGAEAVRQGHAPPVVLTTPELGGVPYPVFYGYLFYPVMNVLAAAVGVRGAIRVAVVAALALQYVSVYRAARGGGATRPLATATAVLTIWTTYPLTNLYHRGALTEFFAVALLTCAACRWFALLDADTMRRRVRAALEVALLYALAAGCHPITALYGLFFLAALSLTVFARAGTSRASAGARLLALVPAAALTLAILAPWAYACAEFISKLSIQDTELRLFKSDIDRWWVRLFPLPLDVRLWDAPAPVSTPHLDAQINLPLVVLAAAVAWGTVRTAGRAGRWLALPVLLVALFLWMSLRTWPYAVLPSAFQMVQFPYRVVTYVNLAALAVVLLAVRLTPHGAPTGWGRLAPEARAAIIACALTLAAAGVLVKIGNVRQEIPPQLQPGRFSYYFYGWSAYATPGQYAALRPAEEAKAQWVLLPPAAEDPHRFGPMPLNSPAPRYVVTQVQPFPWNHFYLDGERVPDSELRVWKGREGQVGVDWYRGPYLAVPVPEGSHVLEHRFEPDRAWLGLYWLAFAAVLAGSVAVLLLHIRRGPTAAEATPPV
jgi:hypothetical protein